MTNLLRWLLFVGRLILGYAAIGVIGGLIGLAGIFAYADPGGAASFALGAITSCVLFLVRRSYRRSRREGRGYALAASFRSFISDDFGHHGRKAA